MFKRFSNNWYPFYAPADAGGSGGGELTKQDIYDALGDEGEDGKDDAKPDDLEEEPDKSKSKDKAKDKDEKKDKSKSDKSDKKSDKKDDKKELDDEDDDKEIDEDDDELDLDELEEDLKEPTEDDLELVTPVSRARILKKYPDLFKDFPYLEKAYFREQQFTEIFPHPSDAKAALEKAEILDNFEKDIFNGDTKTILKAIHDETPQAFNKLIDNYMTVLNDVDPQAHMHVIGNVIKQTIMSMVTAGNRAGNEALKQAAQILNQYVFASSDFEPPTKLSREEKPENEDPEKQQLRKERTELIRARFDEVRGDLNTKVNNSIKSTIEQNIDPRNSMNDYVKRTAIRDALENLESLIEKDTRFKTIVDRLWERAFKENFSRTSVDSIRSAYMSKSKSLLDSVIKKSRIEALKAMGKRTKESDDDNKDKNASRGQRNKSDNDERPRSNRSGGKSSDVPKGMSSLEFLMQED